MVEMAAIREVTAMVETVVMVETAANDRRTSLSHSILLHVFDADGNGKISRAEFLDLQPDHESLFDKADTNGDDHVDCEEFKAAVHIFGGEANCEK